MLIGGLALVARDDGSNLAAPRPRSSASSSASSEQRTSSDSSSSDRSVPPPTATAPQSFDAAIADIKRFVERERGLKFTKDVPVRLAGEGDFQSQLGPLLDQEKPALLEEQEVLVSLGLLDPGSDLVALTRTLAEAGVVGFYNPSTGDLVVRGTAPTPYVRQVIAHELTHALDDQHFNLNRPQLDTADDETSFGFASLTEGDARRVEDAYLASLSPRDQSKSFDEQLQLLGNSSALFSLPPIILTLNQEPYEQGPVLIRALLAAGQQARLDAAFGAPPTTSEQVLDPSVYLRGEGAVPVATPTPDGTVSNKGAIGAFLLRELLSSGGLPDREVAKAVQGWGGDAYVTWHDGQGRSCIKATLVGDTAADTAEIATALDDWKTGAGAAVDRAADGSAVTLSRCA
jgi:hypothetical protein